MFGYDPWVPLLLPRLTPSAINYAVQPGVSRNVLEIVYKWEQDNDKPWHWEMLPAPYGDSRYACLNCFEHISGWDGWWGGHGNVRGFILCTACLNRVLAALDKKTPSPDYLWVSL